jgi:hypothetical protein
MLLKVDPGHRMMERRTFLGVIAGSLLAAPLAAEAQGGKTWRVGFLSGGGQLPDGAPRCRCARPSRSLVTSSSETSST